MKAEHIMNELSFSEECIILGNRYSVESTYYGYTSFTLISRNRKNISHTKIHRECMYRSTYVGISTNQNKYSQWSVKNNVCLISDKNRDCENAYFRNEDTTYWYLCWNENVFNSILNLFTIDLCLFSIDK